MKTTVVGHRTGLALSLASTLGTDVLDFDEQLPTALDGAVIVVGDQDWAPTTMLVDITAEQWSTLAESVIHQSLTALQHAYSSLRARGGTIVVVTPTVGLAGCATKVAHTTAIEAVRALTKSAARQWKGESIVVNLVAVPAGLLQRGTATSGGDTAEVVEAIQTSVEMLLGSTGGGLVGATIVVDGGSVMAP